MIMPMLEVAPKTYGLKAHFEALPVGETCIVYLKDYNYNVIRSTITTLHKKGYKFVTHKKRRKKHARPVQKVEVTRLQ